MIGYILVRCLDIGLFVTTDEPFWLGRSANFFRAMRQGDYQYTFQMAHPGVTTMWAGAASFLWSFPEYADRVTQNLTFVYGIDGVLRDLGQDPMEMLIRARFAKIVVSSLAFAASLFYLNRLFGRAVMVLTGALIALDPFVSGLDSLLHVDGLFAIFAFAAILALADAARANRHAIAPWIVAGVLAFAWMARATGLVLMLGAAVASIAPLFHRRNRIGPLSLRHRLESPAFSLVLWLIGGIAASFLLLPALWVDPFGTFDAIWDWSTQAANEGHERPIFFRGEVISGDPGWLFYPVTLIWRLTPIVLFGALALLILAIPRTTRRLIPDAHRRSLLLIAGFGVAYLMAMSFGAKKFDRYILPVYPIVMLMAGYGSVLLARAVACRRPNLRRFALPAVTAAVLLGQTVSLFAATPYRLDYFSPLLGGLDRAQSHIQVGWGEGAQEAVDFIVQDADGADVLVQVSSVWPVFSYLAPTSIRFERFGLGTPAGWYETDYVVSGIQEWQRDLSPSYRTMRENGFEPVHVVEVHGVPFFMVYAPRQLPLPAGLIDASSCDASFGGGLRLVQVIGREGSVDFYFLTTGELPENLEISIALQQEVDSTPRSAWSAWQPAGIGYVSRVSVPDPRSGESPELSNYELLIQVRNVASGELLPVDSTTLGSDGVTASTNSECFYQP
ncbi:MAG: hypothetical protein IT334_12250 [Thermomicrobiales bacterium]|nr:hypothetical protein [Thermomicrobiales bacterium]